MTINQQTKGVPVKGEVKTYRKNQFNTSEGGTYYGHSNENNAKMAVMLRRIFPSSFQRAQWLGLQQGGALDGSILCSAPSTFQIRCGEAPVQDVAGAWLAENGDIIIGAPKGRIRIFAQSIDLISTGDGDETGWVNILANKEINASAGGEIKMEAGSAFSVEADTMDVNTTGKNEYNVGSFKVIEGGDANIEPGTGNVTLEQAKKSLPKLTPGGFLGGTGLGGGV